MNALHRVIGAAVLAALAYSACSPNSQPAADPATPLEVTEIPPSTEASAPPQAVQIAGPQTGTTMPWVDGSLLVFVPGGEFIMGAEGQDNPKHTVSLSPFWIYRAKVTNRMFALCIAAGKCSPPQNTDALEAMTSQVRQEHPIVGVDWDQADAYCQWAQARLPTEAEWEKTARGPSGNIYPWGDASPTCTLSNFNNCLGRTSKVHDYPSGKSFYEALDLAGNAFEWVQDWYDPIYYQNSPEQDPPGPSSGTNRVVRGSSYSSPDSHLPSSARFSRYPEEYSLDLGFRCVVENPQPFAPYCVTSQFVANPSVPQDMETNPLVTIDQVGANCGVGTVELPGGAITNFETSNGLDCTRVADNRVYCSGQPNTSSSITVCSGEGTGDGVTPTPAADETASCGAGYIPQVNSTQCTFDTSQFTPPFQCGDSSWCSAPDPNTGSCPVGSYFDTLAESCVSSSTPSTACLPGYAYDAAAGCCSSAANQYPGCNASAFETPIGCLIDPSGDGGSGCMEVSFIVGNCSPGQPGEGDGNPGGSAGGSPGGSACPAGQTQYCYFDTGMNQTVCSCQ